MRNVALALIFGATPALEAASFADCETQFATMPGDRAAAACFYEVAHRHRALEEGARRLDALLGRHPDSAWLLHHRARIEWWRSKERAMDYFDRAAREFERLGNAEGEFLSRSGLRDLLVQAGRLDEAGAELERATRLAQQARDPALRAQGLILRGRHLWETGVDLGGAARSLKAAEDFLPADGSEALRMDALVLQGNVLFDLGRYREAVQTYRRLEPIARAAGDELNLAAAEHNIAIAVLLELEERPRKGGRAQVIELARRALRTAEAAGHYEAEAASHRMIGELLGATEDARPEARLELQLCLDVARRRDRRQQEANCLWALGRHFARDDATRARRLLDDALSLAVELGNPTYVAIASRERMYLSWATASDEALEDSLAALDAIERFRDRQPGQGSRAALFTRWVRDYLFASGQLLHRYHESGSEQDLRDAFTLTERMRARVLLEALAAAHAHPPLPGSHSSLAPDDAEFAGLADVQKALAPDEALLSFQLGLWEDLYGRFAGGSWLLVITREQARLHRLPDPTRLHAGVAIVAGLVQGGDALDSEPGLRLYEDLLAEALASLPDGIRQLTIVPDGALNRLPFGALRSSIGAEPLAVRYEISLAPSATLWRHWRTARQPRPEGLGLVLADPSLPALPARRDVAIERGWPALAAEELASLPHARSEARAVRKHLGARTVVLIGEQASETFVKETDLARFGVLHFAAHAIVDEADPQHSALLLSPGGQDDGLLRVSDIVDLDLNGRVVVLSACRTGDGAVVRGEGILSLARAFLQSGARTVVASLWPLSDREASVLFDDFYRRLAAGDGVARAMHKAQSAAWGRGMTSAAWASLVVIGDGASAPLPSPQPEPSRLPLVLAVGVGAAAATGMVLAARRAYARRQE
jgi:CHAT domain-containing protein/tetratricopeptide (TPR) repeat protein